VYRADGLIVCRLSLLVIVTFYFSGTLSGAASALRHSDADPCSGPLTQQGCWEVNNGKVITGLGDRRPGRRAVVDGASSEAAPHVSGRAQALGAFCADARANAAAGSAPLPPEVAALCAPAPGPGPAAALTPGMVLRAFRELPLYRGSIRTDPAGWTLVNLDTYFWCADVVGRSCVDLGEPERLVVLLGREVRIRPHVIRYAWRFGDGQTRAVRTGRVTHVYRSRLSAVVTVTLTWSAEYSVGRGAFQPVGGTTTTTSAPLVLPVREARPVLVGGDSWRAGFRPGGSRSPR
jgi:hypothetical protein